MISGSSGKLKFSLIGGLLLWMLGRSVFAAELIRGEHLYGAAEITLHLHK
jgi:hypothetical protein